MNPLAVVLIILVSIWIILAIAYIIMARKQIRLIKEQIKENKSDEVESLISPSPMVEHHTVVAAEYLTVKGLWDRSVKTYHGCLKIEAFSPYFNFYVANLKDGSSVILRQEK